MLFSGRTLKYEKCESPAARTHGRARRVRDRPHKRRQVEYSATRLTSEAKPAQTNAELLNLVEIS